ncbi:unnamed protein product [Debaryomyces tyrocola]|nr:unnamed protein product [Debaryomyces tyrocola]
MSKLQDLFGVFQEEINTEINFKNKINDLENLFNAELAIIKSEYANLSTIQPINLPYDLSSEDVSTTPFVFALRELDQVKIINSENRHITELGMVNEVKVIDNLNLLSDRYHRYLQELNGINCKLIFKDRFTHKINEEIIYVLMANRYFKAISYIYQVNLKEKQLDKILHPLISKSDQDTMGLVITPEEIQCLLSLEKLNYNDYLLGLLRLIETIVEYTIDTIILISITSENSLNELQNTQYSLSLINLQIVTKLQNGFQMLDLKNDNIRRKFDGLKYNFKKMNGIVYDLSLRKLIVNEVEIY